MIGMFLTEPIARAASRPSSPAERRTALIFALVFIAATVWWTAFGFVLPYSVEFFVAYVTALTLSLSFAATLLVFRARLVGDAASALIAASFVYSVIVIAVYAVTFPGVGPAWLWHPRASPWFSYAWRMGWPAALLWYGYQREALPGRLRRALLVACLCALAVILLALSGTLPPLRNASGASSAFSDAANGLLALIGAFALAGLLRKRPLTTLDTWFAVSLVVAISGSLVLSFSTSRYSTTADLVRISNLTASLIVAGSLVYEFQRLLARSSSLDRFMTMAQYASTIVYLLDADGSCIYVNRRWVEVTGQPAEAAMGRGWTEVVHPDDLAASAEVYGPSLAARKQHVLELRYRCADGSYRWFLASATPTFDVRGELDGWYGTATDVDSQHAALAEARRLEREAAEREDDVRRIVETIPLIAWTTNAAGEIDWCNQRWTDYTGQTRDEALAWGWRTMAHPDDLPLVAERWSESVATATPFEYEFRLRGIDGTYRWFLTRALPITDDAGNVLKWYGTNTDTDEMRRTSDELAALYAREHSLAEMLQTAFIPPFLPNVEGLAFQAVYRPALRELELGGDWYDAFVLRDGRIALSIGDIAGHGIEAAISMVRLRETLRAVTGFVDTDPGSILELADRGFIATSPNSIATAIFALFDPVTRRLVFARAGHPAPALLRQGNASFLASDPGFPLGIEPESRFAVASYVLEPGDTVVFFTDGLLEMDRDIIDGERRLRAMLERYGDDAERLVDETLGDRQRDDVALLQLSVLENAGISSWHFESDDAGSAGDARFAFTAHLRRRELDRDVIAAAELVFGELVGNVVRHAPGSIEIELAWRAGVPYLIVRDRGPNFALADAALPDDPLAEGGRGLFLIARYAGAATVVPRFGGGNEVTVALVAPERDPGAAADELAGSRS